MGGRASRIFTLRYVLGLNKFLPDGVGGQNVGHLVVSIRNETKNNFLTLHQFDF